MFSSAYGGGEEPGVTAIGEMESVPQLVGSHGEVAHGDVGTVAAFQCLSQLFFVGGCGVEDVQLPSGEVGQVSVGYEEVAVVGKGADGKLLCQGSEAPCLHDGGIGFIEP